jgi:hypothetical protein
MRRIAAATVVLILLACKAVEPPYTIPAGYEAYRFAPLLLNYDFIDTTTGTNTHYVWAADPLYLGLNCLALSPRTSPDTTGQFVFVRNGLNQGLMAQYINGVLGDSVIASFFAPLPPGTKGNYAVTSTGRLNLFWADGTQSRYFDPTAVIRLLGDTIFSDVDLRDNGDSVRAQWNVRWLRNPC